jgi:hypothetical protein
VVKQPESVSIKLNAAAILREEMLYRKREEEELKKYEFYFIISVINLRLKADILTFSLVFSCRWLAAICSRDVSSS